MGQQRIDLRVEGMTCDGCAAHVRRALEAVDGVRSVVVPAWQEGRAAMIAESGLLDEALVEAVRAAGYSATVIGRVAVAEETEPVRPGEAEVDLLIIGAGSAGFAAGIRTAELGYSALMVERGPSAGRASTWAVRHPRPFCGPPRRTTGPSNPPLPGCGPRGRSWIGRL